jgi:glycerol-3-phosphate dehydrogenase (NAD(P)+)
MKKITVMGAGAWGSVLAYTLNDPSIEMTIWSKTSSLVDEINQTGKNTKYTGDTFLKNITATTQIQKAVENADILINALPAYAIKDVFTGSKPHIKEGLHVINASKGIDPKTHQIPFEIFEEIFSDSISYFSLSGPSFAAGLLQNHPTTINIAGKNHDSLKYIKDLGRSKMLYFIPSDDVIGVEWGGIYKNVVAIGVGLSAGLGYGENTNALLFSAGFKEMAHSGVKMGAQFETFYQPSGIGDLMLSTSSMKSRNYSFGYYIGQGKETDWIVDKLSGTAEGYYTLQSIIYLKKKYNLRLPLATMLYQIIYQQANPQTEFSDFLEKYAE